MQPMRPRFALDLDFDVDEALRRLRGRVQVAGCPCRLVASERHVDVMIVDELRHFWSPRLSLELTAGQAGSRLNGLYGPNPNVWTMFLAGYACCGFVALFGGMFGFVQLGLGLPAWGLISLPLAALGAVGLYLGSLVGQRLAAEQMELLRCFLAGGLGLVPGAEPGEAVPLDPSPCARAAAGLPLSGEAPAVAG